MYPYKYEYTCIYMHTLVCSLYTGCVCVCVFTSLHICVYNYNMYNYVYYDVCMFVYVCMFLLYVCFLLLILTYLLQLQGNWFRLTRIVPEFTRIIGVC